MFKVLAPGSMMLMGEHAVLHSKHCIVTAINKKLSVALIPNNTKKININSSLGNISLEKQYIKVKKPFQFVLQAIKIFEDVIPSGFNLDIESDINSTVGFGSSAAITSCVVAALLWWVESKKPDNDRVFAISRDVILSQQQSKGSCADLAASVYGGTLAYKVNPLSKKSLDLKLNLTALYSGYKTKTVDVINIVSEKAALNPDLYKSLYELMENCTLKAIEAIESNDLNMLGDMMQLYQSLMVLLGVSDKKLDSMIKQSLENKKVIGAKISGSGLGDCVVAITKPNHNITSEIDFVKDNHKYNIEINKIGLEYAKA